MGSPQKLGTQQTGPWSLGKPAPGTRLSLGTHPDLSRPDLLENIRQNMVCLGQDWGIWL